LSNIFITSNHPFYVQHFCSYLTENMIRVYFKEPKILSYLKGNQFFL